MCLFVLLDVWRESQGVKMVIPFGARAKIHCEFVCSADSGYFFFTCKTDVLGIEGCLGKNWSSKKKK